MTDLHCLFARCRKTHTNTHTQKRNKRLACSKSDDTVNYYNPNHGKLLALLRPLFKISVLMQIIRFNILIAKNQLIILCSAFEKRKPDCFAPNQLFSGMLILQKKKNTQTICPIKLFFSKLVHSLNKISPIVVVSKL